MSSVWRPWIAASIPADSHAEAIHGTDTLAARDCIERNGVMKCFFGGL